MKNQNNPMYVFIVILSLFIFAFGMFVLADSFNIIFYGIVFFIVFFMFFMFITIIRKMNSESWGKNTHQDKMCPHCDSRIDDYDVYCSSCGKKIVDTMLCDYCGHENPPGLTQCEECKGLL